MTTSKYVYRRADTGKFTTPDYAKQHPKTTEKERVYVPSPKKP